MKICIGTLRIEYAVLESNFNGLIKELNKVIKKYGENNHLRFDGGSLFNTKDLTPTIKKETKSGKKTKN